MGQHDRRLLAAKFLHEIVNELIRDFQWIITSIKEANLGAKYRGRPDSFPLPYLLDVVQRHAFLLPQPLRLTAFAVRQAQDPHLVTTRAVQGNRASGPPDKIGDMRADYQYFLVC